MSHFSVSDSQSNNKRKESRVDRLSSAAALGALKRQQLVSLSKKYGLKASGKVSYQVRCETKGAEKADHSQNIEIIERLQDCESLWFFLFSVSAENISQGIES